MTLPIPREEIDSSIAPLAADGSVELALFHDTHETTVVADVSAVVALECSRCLCDFEMEITTQFTMTLKKGNPGTVSEDSDIPVLFYDAAEGLVEIGATVAEEIGVNVPMQPLCDDLCKGLCVNCGADLNNEECNCKSNENLIKES
jgi:uncharacterized protein